nr:hypothetical protein [uncultured Undibacterium sp.]
MWLEIAGSLNSLLIIASLWGIWSQVKKVWHRKQEGVGEGSATAILSLNQFSVSYLAYWSFFVYGYSIKPFNHFIVWPRLIAAILVMVLLYEIWRDRRSSNAKAVFWFASLMLLLGLIGLSLAMLHGPLMVDQGRAISQVLIVTITILLAQAYAHQIRLILASGSTGAVSIRMSQFIFAMDLSSIFLGLMLGFKDGWPLLLLASVSAVTKLVMMYLFYWVRASEVAMNRRAV